MKLQFKLALYNILVKAATIVFLGILIVIFIKNISISHIQARLKEKRTKIISHLSAPEIIDFLARQGNYTDYNLLREEYFTLAKIPKISTSKEKFTTEERTIEGDILTYEILMQDFNHNGAHYRLELGEALTTVDLLEETILKFTLIILVVSAIITLSTDLVFSKYLLSPFYKIIDEKINKVNDPIHFSYIPIKTTTTDFVLLDESISMLMNKLKMFMLTEKEFIANVSHELLTPISILMVRMENLLNEENLSTDGENKIFANLKTLNRLKSIINSLLMISKIEHHQYSRADTISIRDVITDVVNELDHRLLMKNLSIAVSLPKDFIFTGNASLINILITNLISNAIKYNVEKGKIVISSNFDNRFFELLISDTGIGIEAGQLGQIFERFEQLNRGEEGGHGLGLAIVKHIADFHGITIGVNSAINKGTEVVLRFFIISSC
ncbi:MAG: HAMP domain-containing histidine kinase [Pedobacter sp.]|nr:HAMP domain-containing histidine kinase [Pedobacter sp.]